MPKTTGIRPTPPKLEKFIDTLASKKTFGSEVSSGESGSHFEKRKPTQADRRDVLEDFVVDKFGPSLVKGKTFQSCSYGGGEGGEICERRPASHEDLRQAVEQYVDTKAQPYAVEAYVSSGGEGSGHTETRIPSEARDFIFDQLALKLIPQ